MSRYAARAPLSVYLLADHLDGALAAGEDLVARGHDWRSLAEDPGEPSEFATRQRRIAEEVRGLELMLIARVLKETGIRLEIISAREEARLAVLGCHALLEPGDGPALNFDIGGGSTELVLIESAATGLGGTPRVLDWHSSPWGVVSLTETAGVDAAASDDPAARAAAYARMREIAAESFAAFAARLPRDVVAPRLLGTSGTVTTLGSVYLGLPHYDRAQVDGLVVPADAMRRISQDLAHKSIAERGQVPCIGPERADLVVAGCAILETILDLWPAERLGVADRGIREGILRRLMGTPRP